VLAAVLMLQRLGKRQPERCQRYQIGLIRERAQIPRFDIGIEREPGDAGEKIDHPGEAHQRVRIAPVSAAAAGNSTSWFLKPACNAMGDARRPGQTIRHVAAPILDLERYVENCRYR
jgi:hypothetical protein